MKKSWLATAFLAILAPAVYAPPSFAADTIKLGVVDAYTGPATDVIKKVRQ